MLDKTEHNRLGDKMVKLGQLINPAFQEALGNLAQEKLPATTSYKLKKSLKSLGEEIKTYNDVRTDLLNKFGDKQEDGSLSVDENNNVKFSGDNLKLFSDALTELLNTEVEFAQLKLLELGDKVNISANNLSMLDGVVVE